MNFPDDLQFTRDHEWARVQGKRITVGITDFAQDQLGDVVYVELPEVGDELKRGETFGVVESTKAVSDLFAPVSGKVVEVNGPLVDAPQSVNEDPYEEGWMIVVEISDPAELSELMDAKTYRKFVEEEQE